MEKNALTAKEIGILDILCQKAQWKNVFIERNSDREFDVHIFADDGIEVRWKISSSMYLAIIKSVNWKDKRIWGLTDAYGDKGYIPSQGCDWRGIQESSLATIWEMTDVAVKMLEAENNCKRRTAEEVMRMFAMFGNFETRAELLRCVVKRKDPFMTHMAEAYAIFNRMK